MAQDKVTEGLCCLIPLLCGPSDYSFGMFQLADPLSSKIALSRGVLLALSCNCQPANVPLNLYGNYFFIPNPFLAEQPQNIVGSSFQVTHFMQVISWRVCGLLCAGGKGE